MSHSLPTTSVTVTTLEEAGETAVVAVVAGKERRWQRQPLIIMSVLAGRGKRPQIALLEILLVLSMELLILLVLSVRFLQEGLVL